MKRVYHASPEADITKFCGRYSPIFGKKGIFVTESYYSLINDWTPYVGHKKHPAKIKAKNPDDRSKKNNKNREHYTNITIYTLKIPKHIYELSKKEYRDLEDALEFAEKFPMSVWGEETFISEEYLDKVIIMGKKTIRYNDVIRSNIWSAQYKKQIINLVKIARSVKKTNDAAELYLFAKDKLTNMRLKDEISLEQAIKIDKFIEELVQFFFYFEGTTPILNVVNHSNSIRFIVLKKAIENFLEIKII